MLEEFELIMQEYKEDNHVIKTSSQLLLYHVEDVLGMAQIKSGKFSKQMENFDLKLAVEEIMGI